MKHHPAIRQRYTYTAAEVEWLLAVAGWQKRFRNRHPTAADLFGIAWGLGYRLRAAATEPPRFEGRSKKEGPMTVRAKVTCEAIDGNAVSFHTVYETDEQKGADPENVRFTKATPWGNIKLGIDNPAALERFKVGEQYYVDFTPAKKS